MNPGPMLLHDPSWHPTPNPFAASELSKAPKLNPGPRPNPIRPVPTRGGFDLKDAQRVLTAALEIRGKVKTCSASSHANDTPSAWLSAFNSSIGGHYRQCLDHFTNFLRALESNELDYDRGESYSRVESDPGFALRLTRRMRKDIQLLTPDDLARAVRTRCEVSYGRGDSPVIVATYGRELVYAIAHAIQHYALISVMAQLLDVTVPPHFGTRRPLSHAREIRTSTANVSRPALRALESLDRDYWTATRNTDKESLASTNTSWTPPSP